MIPLFYHEYSDQHLAHSVDFIFEQFPDEAHHFFLNRPESVFHPLFNATDSNERLGIMHQLDPDRTFFTLLANTLTLNVNSLLYCEQQYHQTHNLRYMILYHFNRALLQRSHQRTIEPSSDLPSFEASLAYFAHEPVTAQWANFFAQHASIFYALHSSPADIRWHIIGHCTQDTHLFQAVFMYLSAPATPQALMKALINCACYTPLEKRTQEVFYLIQEGLLSDDKAYTYLYTLCCQTDTSHSEIPLHF